MSGRPKDAIWSHFIKISNNKSSRAKCIECGAEMCTIVDRMKKHFSTCEKSQKNMRDTEIDEPRKFTKYLYNV